LFRHFKDVGMQRYEPSNVVASLFWTTLYSIVIIIIIIISVSLQSSAVEQVLDILMDILSWDIAEVVSPCLPRGL